MISWFNYIIESSIVLALLMLFYRMVLSKEKCITYNRFYLLGVGLTSALLPLIDFPFISIPSGNTTLNQVYEIPAVVSQITTFPEPKAQGFESFVEFISLIYLAGVAVMLILLFVKLFRLIQLIRNTKSVNQGKYNIVLTDGKLPTFSFGNYLFLNQMNKSKSELEAIVKHEEAHIKQKHSFDILLAELYKIFFWFNPLSYQLEKSIKLNHEFLADRFALQSTAQTTYIEALVKQVYKNTISPVVHYFGLHSTEKRIRMIRQNIDLSAFYKPYFSIPMMALLVFSFSCHFQPEVIELVPIGKTIAPELLRNEMASLQKAHLERDYYFKFVSSPELEKIKAKDYNQYTIDHLTIMDKQANIYGMIYSFDKQRNLPNVFFSTEVFTFQQVTEIPTPWNGYEALLSSIDRHASALVTSKQDKVIWVRFVVNTFGEVVHTNIVNEDYKLMTDSEAKEYGAAIKAITATSNQWRIGKINNIPVNVEMDLPVRLYKD